MDASRCGFSWIVLLVLTCASHALGAPPPGFTALFNGKDLGGWHGRPQLDPRKWEAMNPDQQRKKLSEWREEFQKHWRVEKGELVNNGQGPYATTDQDYSDIELLIEYKTVAKADSGIYLRATPQVQNLGLHQGGRQMGARSRQRFGRTVQQQPRRAGSRSLGFSGQTVW
jgi:hypothetical protein